MIVRFCIFLLLVPLCSSCIRLGESAPPGRYYLLETAAVNPVVDLEKRLTVSIELSDFPEYLRRSQVVSRQRKNMIHFNDAHRWAQPLDINLLQVVRDNLRLMVPDATFIIQPWETGEKPDTRIRLMIGSFSGAFGEQTDIDIRWQVSHATGVHREGHLTDNGPIGDSYQDLAAGLSHGLERLSIELARGLAEPVD